MVDLRATLRPLVDEPAAARLPVAELADRARRKRLRRRTALAGLAATAVVVVGAGSLLVGHDDDRVTTDGPPAATTPVDRTVPPTAPPSTAPPSTAPTGTTAAPSPSTTAPPAAAPAADLVVSETTTSSWDAGHCVEVRVENPTDAPVEWSVTRELEGAIASVWNARTTTPAPTAGTEATFTGDAWNRTLAPGTHTTFGLCLDT